KALEAQPWVQGTNPQITRHSGRKPSASTVATAHQTRHFHVRREVPMKRNARQRIRQKPPERLSSTMTVASNPEVPRSKRYFVTCAIWTEKSIAAASSGMPNTPAMMSGRALSHRSFGSERPAYSANSSDIAHQHMGRFRQDAGRNADRARGPPQTVGRTHSQLGSSGPGHCD